MMRSQSEPPGFDIWDVQRSLISELNVLHNKKKWVWVQKKSVFCENMKCKFSLLLRDLAVLYYGWKWDSVRECQQQTCRVICWCCFVCRVWGCGCFLLWSSRMDDTKAGASLQTNRTDQFTRMQTSSEWLFLRCSAFDLREAVTVKRFLRRLENKCNPVHAVRDNHSTSLVGQKQWNILLLDCSCQGDSLILHIPVFTKALVV